ncbi:MAG: metal-dependent transcriptional regulator, partial [Eudoraea sp.]|nr:metal-dependent transcriptional regulator [Eudoraea sp.]
SLSSSGAKKALSIIRKHRLWETFLVEKLNFTWDEVHEVAEQLEHVESDKLVDQLDLFLSFPKVDPHGDPIPDKNGELVEEHSKVLSKLPVNSSCVCVGVKDSSPSFLKYLDKNGIALGNRMQILEKEEFDNSIHIQIQDRRLHLSHLIASNLYVK